MYARGIDKSWDFYYVCTSYSYEFTLSRGVILVEKSAWSVGYHFYGAARPCVDCRGRRQNVTILIYPRLSFSIIIIIIIIRSISIISHYVRTYTWLILTQWLLLLRHRFIRIRFRRVGMILLCSLFVNDNINNMFTRLLHGPCRGLRNGPTDFEICQYLSR